MKRTYIIYLIVIFGFLAGCAKDDFLEKYPLTAVSPELFFKTGNDFKIYANQFYDDLGDWTGYTNAIYDDDNGTDNLISALPDVVLNGQNLKTVSDIDWTNNYISIRKVNILLSNTGGAPWDDIKGYVAEARFFRAWYYFNLLRKFGGVPWISKPLSPSDKIF